MIAEIDVDSAGSAALFRSYAWGNDLSGTPQGAGGVGGLLMIQERDLRRRHLAIQTTPPAVYAPCTDLNGNILSYIEINRGEGLTHSFEYDAFGKELTADTLVPVGNGTTKETLPFRFSTKYHDDETGLAYYGYRYYSADMGRWLNRDPIAEQGGINIYAMVGNDAVNQWDYLGHRAEPVCTAPMNEGNVNLLGPEIRFTSGAPPGLEDAAGDALGQWAESVAGPIAGQIAGNAVPALSHAAQAAITHNPNQALYYRCKTQKCKCGCSFGGLILPKCKWKDEEQEWEWAATFHLINPSSFQALANEVETIHNTCKNH